MSQPSSGKKASLKRPVEQIRDELLKDADTQRIAKAVGMELEAYVDLVLDYLQNPDKQPELHVASDEDLREAGYDPPSAEDVANFFIAGANGELGIAGTQFEKSEFSSAPSNSGKPSLSGDAPARTAQGPQREAPSKDLQDQLRRGGKGGNV